MNTTLRMKIIVRSAAGATASKTSDAGASPGESRGPTDPREFLAMRARHRKAQARRRRWTRSGLVALGACGVLMAAVTLPRARRHAAVAMPAPPPAPATPPEPPAPAEDPPASAAVTTTVAAAEPA